MINISQLLSVDIDVSVVISFILSTTGPLLVVVCAPAAGPTRVPAVSAPVPAARSTGLS